MDPDALAAAGAKMLSATGKFTSGLAGDPLVVSNSILSTFELNHD